MARETPPSGESAISGERDITELFVGVQSRQPRDSILQARGGGDWALYEDLLRDDQVKATFQQRGGAVVSRDWIVDPGGDSAADQTAAAPPRAQRDAIRCDDATAKMLSSLFYGFAVGEFIWVRDGRRWMAEAVKARNRRRFRWERAGNPRLLTRDTPGGAAAPRVWRRVEDAPDLKALAERDEIPTRMGYRPSPRAIAETYGDGSLDIGLVAAARGPTAWRPAAAAPA